MILRLRKATWHITNLQMQPWESFAWQPVAVLKHALTVTDRLSVRLALATVTSREIQYLSFFVFFTQSWLYRKDKWCQQYKWRWSEKRIIHNALKGLLNLHTVPKMLAQPRKVSGFYLRDFRWNIHLDTELLDRVFWGFFSPFRQMQECYLK